MQFIVYIYKYIYKKYIISKEYINDNLNLFPQVLIDVHYCALNTSDTLLSKNLYTFEPKLPKILGYEVVGKLVEVGTEAEKNGYKIGDKVIALNKERYGGLAEKCLAEIGVRCV